MPLKNTSQNYGSISKLFHWTTTLLILGLFIAAYVMMDMAPSDTKWQVYGLHKSFGLLVLFLTLTRLMWRVMNTPPKLIDNLKLWQVAFAHFVHFSLYILLLAMPISGYVMSTASGREVFFFKWKLPSLLEKNHGLADAAHEAHSVISYVMLTMFSLHIIGALWHHFWLKDNTLRRMLSQCSSSCGKRTPKNT